MHSGVHHTLDFDRDGKHFDWLSIPVSVDRSPYFQVKVPVCVIRNGVGPRVLLMAGNHGDEYEGELCLARLARRIDPSRLNGTLTLLPMANAPAVRAAKRCSPIDGGNLNRAFPGDPTGTATSRIAHALEHDLFPRHDVVFDLHSGGTSMAHLPCGLIESQDDAATQSRALELMRSLGLPFGFVAENGRQAPTSMGAARRAGVIGLSGEFGGGGTASPRTMRATAQAIDGLLLKLAMIDVPVLGRIPTVPTGPMQILSLARHSQAIYAMRHGWFEPAVDLGATVAAGDLAGWYHDLERLEMPEEPLLFAEGGIVISHRLHTMSEAGDCLIQVAEPIAQ
ncbi:succinylglutamate desuccinylase/aspartoacylase domain-containing protein [Lichenifustis flavocetrariae]|uniref:Succinylglutamate desuccinylase/aspartoacylase family protein n=1 Tax=Lichenifustis flavocetrariae TaxID=2949735 RepID=A0AA42CLY3_9HYPH|nr:succinylglutamate desuccinylase/aspartoacylase family protein [Lichenifustis flavocetrariae]MCW6510936.1 succinylglutamate desuccinylase/aspartoacylase family protein [Lichenifustis flavocetrariae]